LIKTAICSRARTARLVVLLAAAAGVLVVLLVAIGVISMWIGPGAAAAVGGVPVGSAFLAGLVRLVRGPR
jgi:hypothetical protein